VAAIHRLSAVVGSCADLDTGGVRRDSRRAARHQVTKAWLLQAEYWRKAKEVVQSDVRREP
jgi:hypothetical protein